MAGDDKKDGTILGLSQKTMKYIGYGLLAGGVVLGGYAIYKTTSKKKSGALSGTGKRKSKKIGKHQSGKKKAKYLLKGF